MVGKQLLHPLHCQPVSAGADESRDAPDRSGAPQRGRHSKCIDACNWCDRSFESLRLRIDLSKSGGSDFVRLMRSMSCLCEFGLRGTTSFVGTNRTSV